MSYQFDEVITSLARIRELLGTPSERAIKKERSQLERHSRAFIAKSPFVLIASSDAGGHLDVSPKGDPPGFVRVLDDSTLAIPDRLGNRRVDGLRNILDNPHVGLLFLVPGREESLRVNGRAQIVRDQALNNSLRVAGKAPELAIVVAVEQVFMHCAKCLIRSAMWKASTWPPPDALASLAECLVEQAGLTDPVATVHAALENDKRERLY